MLLQTEQPYVQTAFTDTVNTFFFNTNKSLASLCIVRPSSYCNVHPKCTFEVVFVLLVVSYI